MKTILFSILLTLTFFNSEARTCDIAIRILQPQNGDSIHSPSIQEAIFSIHNLGPDTVKYNDMFFLKLIISNLVFNYGFRNFGYDLAPGDSIIYHTYIGLNYTKPQPKIPFCGIIQSVKNTVRGDTLVESEKKLSNNQSCCDVAHVVHYTGIAPLKDQLNVYPNPTRETVNIEIPANIISAQINLFGMSGQRIAISQDKIEITNHILKLKLPKLMPGVYLLNCRINDIVYRKNLLIQ